jgi:tetratricopeptide (TPR) repeat protein
VSFRKLIVCAAIAVPLCAGTAAAPRELLLRIQQVIQQGDLAAARNQLTAALGEFPSEPVLHNLLGVVEAQQGNRQAAEANFKKALEHAPDFTGALMNLARLYQEKAATDPKSLGQALDAYQRVLKYDGGNVEALYQSAFLLVRTGSYQASLDHLNRLPAEMQERAQALAVRCADEAALGRRAPAAVTAEQLLKSPDLSEEDVVVILPHVQATDEKLAIRMLEKLVERRLAGGVGLARLGWLYKRQGQLALARETLERAAQAAGPSAELLTELARVAYQQRDHEGALGYLGHARDLEPRNAGIHFFFGMVCVELNLPIDARKSLDEAVRLDPENAYYNYALGAVAVHGRPGESIPYFEKYIARKPDDPRGRFALGAAHFYAGDYEAAQKDLRSVASRPETAAGAHYFLGRIAKLQQDLPEAENELTQAIAANPKFTDAMAELGHVHIRTERYEEAAKTLERARALDPDNFRVNANLLILYQKTKDPRAEAQQQRFEEIKKKRAADEELLWRSIEVRPY